MPPAASMTHPPPAPVIHPQPPKYTPCRTPTHTHTHTSHVTHHHTNRSSTAWTRRRRSGCCSSSPAPTGCPSRGWATSRPRLSSRASARTTRGCRRRTRASTTCSCRPTRRVRCSRTGWRWRWKTPRALACCDARARAVDGWAAGGVVLLLPASHPACVARHSVAHSSAACGGVDGLLQRAGRGRRRQVALCVVVCRGGRPPTLRALLVCQAWPRLRRGPRIVLCKLVAEVVIGG